MKSRVTKAQADRWKKTKVKGRWHYVFFFGVLFWGIGVSLLTSAITVLIEDGLITETFLENFLDKLKSALPTFMIAGGFFGLFMWNWYCKAHESYIQDSNETL